MRPVDQTVLSKGDDGEEPGDCWAACIATILGLPIEGVPNFAVERSMWWEETCSWLQSRKLGLLPIEGIPRGRLYYLPRNVPFILSGMGPRGVEHAVVARVVEREAGAVGLVIEHDPHPSREGLTEPRETCSAHFFVPMNPEAI